MLRSLAKLFALTVMVAGAGYGLWRYEQYRASAALREMARQNRQLEFEKQELASYVSRLTAERRVAEIVVTEQVRGPASVKSTTLMFVEYGRDGNPLPPRFFTVEGDGAHIDSLVIKFDRDLVMKDDGLRGHSLVLFYRLFGDHQTPAEGYRIDEPGQIPPMYRDGTLTTEKARTFEAELWEQVWKLSEDEAHRRKMGVRVLSKESPWGTFEPEKRYTITLEAAGGLTLHTQPLDGQWRQFRDAVKRVK